MRDSIQIRPAQPGDARTTAVLLYSAYTHTPLTSSQREEHESGFIERLEHFFRLDGNRFSYQHIQVALYSAEVVGLVLSFGGRDEIQLNAAAGSWLEREAQEDEWYIDALAVFKDWSHKGIGTRLLQTAEQQARQQHYTKIALNVARGNKDAVELYTHLHYVVTRKTVLYHRLYVRMVKILANGEQGKLDTE